MSFTQALLAVGTGLQIFGQIQQSRQQAQLLEFNSAVNRQKAELTKISGDLEINQLRRRKRQLKSAQVAAFAAAGVRITGSPLQTISDSLAQSELDILTTDFDTRVSILNATSDAELDLIRARITKRAGLISAGTTLLSVLPSFLSSGNIPTTVSTTPSAAGIGGGTPGPITFGGAGLNI